MSKDLMDVAPCTLKDTGIEITGEDAPPIVESLNEYLSVFAALQKRDGGNSITGSLECLKCNAVLNGFLGSFRWGIVNGEGECSECGWPARALHRPKDSEGEMIFDRPLEMILQYHPSGVSKRDESDE